MKNIVIAFVMVCSSLFAQAYTFDKEYVKAVIRQCAKDGIVCEAIGHHWKTVADPCVPLLRVEEPRPTESRKCMTCERQECRQMGDWK